MPRKKGRNLGRATTRGSADAAIARTIAESRVRGHAKAAAEHASVFDRDGFALDAWDALAHALQAGKLPPESVVKFFIGAAGKLNAVEDAMVGGVHLVGGRIERREAKRWPIGKFRAAVLDAIGFSTRAADLKRQLSRSGDTRWRDRQLVGSIIARTQVHQDKLDIAVEHAAHAFGVSPSTAWRVFRAWRHK